MKLYRKKAMFIGFGNEYDKAEENGLTTHYTEYSFNCSDVQGYKGLRAESFRVSAPKMERLLSYKCNGKLTPGESYVLILEDYKDNKKFTLSTILPFDPNYNKENN